MPVAAKPFFIMAYNPWRALGRVSALELSDMERRSPEPCDMRQHRSPPSRWGEVRSRETRGSAGARLSRQAESRVVGHAAALEPT
jgi:hypothetical protein